MYKSFVKSFFDFFGGLFLFLILFPFFIVTLLLLLIVNRGKPFFYQHRPGKGGKVFKIIKFKTMIDAKGPDGRLLSDRERLTPIGKFVRKTSLDEIPQLINVIKGDMSLVGPRPLLVEYLPLYSLQQRRRHEVRPGITGWAQVNGRNTITWKKKFEYDVWYVEHCSFNLDVKILCMTLLKVIRSEGINSATAVTMEKFTGD